MNYSGLLTDLYELTMMQGYLLQNRNENVVFDVFFRKHPFSGGYSILTGIEDVLNLLPRLSFSEDDIAYLRSLNRFEDRFLDYLRNFKFTGDVYTMDEGDVIFPQEPLLRIHSTIMEAQLIESIILNTINFQTLIATKAARVVHAAGGSGVLEFGLRRAQGVDGALSASRAAYIGGVIATSNTLAGKLYNIPVTGSMAHSWVMAHDNELQSFAKFAELYPDAAILLIDTFDTLGSGIENAIKIGLDLKKKGKSIMVRLDSGDLFYLSNKIREKLDNAGLQDAKIVVSNDLNEEIIHQMVTDGVPIDFWGVGTQLVTGGIDSAFGGVYKLCAKENSGRMVPTIKVSNNAEKTSNPGVKQVYRFYDSDGYAIGDMIALQSEKIRPGRPYKFYHPTYFHKKYILNKYSRIEPLLKLQMENGVRTGDSFTLQEIQQKVQKNLTNFDKTYKRILNPHIYKISLSETLKKLKAQLIDEYK